MTPLEENALKIEAIRSVMVMQVNGYDNSGRPAMKGLWSEEEMALLKEMLLNAVKKMP